MGYPIGLGPFGLMANKQKKIPQQASKHLWLLTNVLICISYTLKCGYWSDVAVAYNILIIALQGFFKKILGL